jgi:hypothetical protein
MLDREGWITHASPRAMRWLSGLGLLDGDEGEGPRLGLAWGPRLWECHERARPGEVTGLPMRVGLRRALVVMIEPGDDGQITATMQLVRIPARIDSVWWKLLGDGS